MTVGRPANVAECRLRKEPPGAVRPNLLTQVALTIGSRQGENVATAALVHLLARSPASAEAATAHFSDASGVRLPAGVSFTSQVGRAGAGVADAVAIDAAGTEQMILEAKIGAGFHGEQLAAYVRRLVEAEPGLLMILTPERRSDTLWQYAVEQLSAAIVGPRQAMISGVIVGVTGWESLLDAIGATFQADPLGRAEFDQLRGLFDYLSAGVVLPVDTDDVTSERGRIISSINQIAERVVESIASTSDELVQASIRSKGGGFFGAGASLRLAGVLTWFGVWLPHWAQTADTPYWLQFKGWDGTRGPRLASAISKADGVIVAFHRGPASDVIAGLAPPLGVDAAVAIDRLTATLRSVASAVKSASVLPTEAMPGSETH